VRYREQQQYLNGSSIWGTIVIVPVAFFALHFLEFNLQVRPLVAIEFMLIVIAIIASIYYTPDYLHLTVTPDKPLRWQIRARWRIIGAVLLLAAALVTRRSDAVVLAVAVAWMLASNFMARRLGRLRPALYFYSRDLVLIAALIFTGRIGVFLTAVLVAASAHLSAVVVRRFPLSWGALNASLGCFVLVGGFWRDRPEPRLLVGGCGLILSSALATAFLVWRAQHHNARNVSLALKELMDFTGYPADRVVQLWATSNQDLARNWNTDKPPQSDAARLAEWYRENSELYLFAISAYNLEYKRIRSNLKVLKYARGSCLDYGAGNGEIVLEIARRGQPAAYYDVEGVTMNFARKRAEEQKLDVKFYRSKNELAGATSADGFDTVFSFDVLEHLPDLEGELTFLSSLLRPGGLFVFDVPAGSTKAHPMHLNHHVDVVPFLRGKGLKDERGLLQRPPFSKEEKYFFRVPRGAVVANGGAATVRPKS